MLNIEPEVRENESYTLTLLVDGDEFVLDAEYKGFDINNFKYDICLEELPETMTDRCKEIFKLVALSGVTDKEFKDEYDISIIFNSSNLKGYNQIEREFIFSEMKSNRQVELRCKRNVQEADFQFNLIDRFV